MLFSPDFQVANAVSSELRFLDWKMLESNPDTDVLYFQKSSSSEQLATI